MPWYPSVNHLFYCKFFTRNLEDKLCHIKVKEFGKFMNLYKVFESYLSLDNDTEHAEKMKKDFLSLINR